MVWGYDVCFCNDETTGFRAALSVVFGYYVCKWNMVFVDPEPGKGCHDYTMLEFDISDLEWREELGM